MSDPILAKVLDGIAEVARIHLGHEGPLPLEARLLEDLELDSIQLLTLAVEVENVFRVCLDEEETEIATVSDLARAVTKKLAEKDRPAP